MPVEQLIFTHRPVGKGFDPQGTGFQVAACSSGLDASTRDALAKAAMHCRHAVYDNAPPDLRDREPTPGAQDYPPDLLAEFPVVWRYDRLRDDRFALAHVRYIGFTDEKNRRTGNFLYHVLVLEPESLAPHNFNPLTAARAGVFLTQDPRETSLPALPDLKPESKAGPSVANSKALRAEPFRQHVPAMAGALTSASALRRPVLICLADWRQAAPLIESLLTLLPPVMRCRTTFCTSESDRRWTPFPSDGQVTTDGKVSDILVLCGSNDQAFNLFADDYRTNYAVFNFVGNRFSDLGEAGAFAKFAAACVAEDRPERLKRLHELIERWGSGRDPATWNSLALAAGLLEDRPPQQSFADATVALVAAAREPAQVGHAEDLLLPHLQTLSREPARNVELFGAASAHLAALADRGTVVAEASRFVAGLRELARQALVGGHGRTAEAMFKACGRAREAALLDTLRETFKEFQASLATSSHAADRAAIVGLLLEGAKLAEKSPNPEPLATRLLAATFRAARDAQLLANTWKEQGGAMVKARLGAAQGPEAEQLRADLAASIVGDQCPEGCFYIRLKVLEATQTTDEKTLVSALEQLATSSTQCPKAEEAIQEVLGAARKLCSDAAQHAVALGRMASVVPETGCGSAFYSAYRNAMKQSVSSPMTVRGTLADAGARGVVCREFLEELLPWHGEASQRSFDSWYDGLIKGKQELLVSLFERVAGLLPCGATGNVLPLAELLLARGKDKVPSGPALAALYDAIASALPLQPESWNAVYASPPQGLNSRSQRRLRVVEFLHRLKERSTQPGWSVLQFDSTDRAWSRDVAELDGREKQDVIRQCIASFQCSGITSPDEARALVKMLEAVGVTTPERGAEVVCQLLQGRDPVTWVLALTALARCSLEGASPEPARWGALIRAILGSADRTTCQLLPLHLSRRFAPGGAPYEERMRDLCRAAGVEGVSIAAFAPKPPAPAADAQPENSSGNLLFRGWRFLQRVVRGSGTPPPGSGDAP